MQVEELKNIVKDSATVLVMDKGEPLFVVMDYKSYKSMSEKSGSGNGKDSGNWKESEILDKLNKDILALKHQLEMEEGRNLSTGID